MKKLLLSLLVAATLTGTVAMPVSAAEAGTNVSAFGTTDISNWQRLGDDTDSEIYKGKIINSESGQEIVMQVNEDGSYATMPFSMNTYSAMAKSSCPHSQWKQIEIAQYQGKQWVRKSICYNEVFKVKYQCRNPKCKMTRTMTTYISYKHRYSKNRCTQCGMRKK